MSDKVIGKWLTSLCVLSVFLLGWIGVYFAIFVAESMNNRAGLGALSAIAFGLSAIGFSATWEEK